MREIVGIEPYSELPVEIGDSLRVSSEPQVYKIANYRTGTIEHDRTGRVRIVIEGERELVGEALGKNFFKRLARPRERL